MGYIQRRICIVFARIASRRIFNSDRQIGAYSDLREAKGRLKGSGGREVWEEKPMAVG